LGDKVTKSLAVIESNVNSYHLVVEDNGEYWTIPGITTLAQAMQLRLSDLRELVEGQVGEMITGKLTGPVSPEIEIWGAGVTYLRSRDARKEESGVPDVYQRVYEADRPELFLKSSAVRTVGTGAEIGIRADCAASVPEPEVAIIVNIFQEVIGLSICNDVTARTIEGINPLYLSQAKIYVGSNALGPVIKPIWQIESLLDIGIAASIRRDGKIIWEAKTSLSALHRTFEDLISYLFRCQVFPHGVILSTGTGIVPPMEIALSDGDVVTITVDEIGTLSNTVAVISEESHNIALGISK
jgi:2-dehydro-3-deoxy-D-arabinonate dehydratase